MPAEFDCGFGLKIFEVFQEIAGEGAVELEKCPVLQTLPAVLLENDGNGSVTLSTIGVLFHEVFSADSIKARRQ